MSSSSHDMSANRLFQFYLQSFFKIPKDISRDIIYCQRALKAHIKVHQMVLDVFQQQTDADPEQKKRILDELKSEIYEINAEQNFLFLRLRRIKDEFLKMLTKNDVPIDPDAIDAFISNEIVPRINDANLIIVPTTIMLRNDEEKLIEKYFEVQKDTKEHHELMEVIDLDDDDATDNVEETVLYKTCNSGRNSEYNNTFASSERESLLKNMHGNMEASQPSLLKPFSQRMLPELVTHDGKPYASKAIKTLGDLYKKKKEEKFVQQKLSHELMAVDVKPNIIKPVKTIGDLYQQTIDDNEKAIELPVSTNVKMSRLNLRQALKRAQAAVRGPTNVAAVTPVPPPPPQPPATAASSSTSGLDVVTKKSNSMKTRAARAAVGAPTTAIITSASGLRKSPAVSSSSGEGTPERGNSPPHNYWPDEFEETRTKAEEYGQENFLRFFDLFTPELHAQMQQRRSKRRRRCVQNNNYHYGRIESHPPNPSNEPDAKKKRKAFLLSPQVKKALPSKRAKRRSADNAFETNSAPTSRSASSSPNDKRICNECLKSGLNLEQCEECKLFFHAQCHREIDNPMIAVDPRKDDNNFKKCPSCKRKYEKALQEDILQREDLQRAAQDLELQIAKEKDRHEILERTSKSYKIQMHNLFKIVNSLKTEPSTSYAGNANIIGDANDENNVIQLD